MQMQLLPENSASAGRAAFLWGEVIDAVTTSAPELLPR